MHGIALPRSPRRQGLLGLLHDVVGEEFPDELPSLWGEFLKVNRFFPVAVQQLEKLLLLEEVRPLVHVFSITSRVGTGNLSVLFFSTPILLAQEQVISFYGPYDHVRVCVALEASCDRWQRRTIWKALPRHAL